MIQLIVVSAYTLGMLVGAFSMLLLVKRVIERTVAASLIELGYDRPRESGVHRKPAAERPRVELPTPGVTHPAATAILTAQRKRVEKRVEKDDHGS